MPPILQTRRLYLRPPRPDDLADIYRLGSNPNVMRYITSGKTQNLDEARLDLEKRMRTSGDRFGYWIAELIRDQQVIGWMALKQLDETPDIEIGYRFMEEFWGKGYATEGSRRILEYAFNDLRLPRVVAVAVEENLASTRVMEKLGMQMIRYGRYYNTDCVCYAIRREQFLATI